MASVIGHSDDLLEQLKSEAESKDLSTEEYILQILSSRHEGRESEEAVSDLQAELASKEEKIQELENDLTQYANVEADLREKIAELQAEHDERIAELKKELDAREERIEELQAELDERTDGRVELEEKVGRLRSRLESREDRISELETQLAKRSQIEDKVEELSIEVREERKLVNAPFFIRWWRWIRE